MLDPDEIAPESTRPLSRREYEALVRLGTFEGERVELLYGTLVTMSPHGPEHDEATNDLAERLIAALGERAKVRVQSAFAASDESEPEPDLAVVPRRSYRDAHPDEAYLIVEVARSSLAKDRGIKARLYAESGVEEYWVVDLKAGAVEVHRDPRDGTYATRTRHARGDELTLARFPDLRLKVADIVS